MKVRIADIDPKAQERLPENRTDESGVGINYVDAYIKPIKLTLEDGSKITCKRRGLKITLSVGDKVGVGLLRRLKHGPAVKTIVQEAMAEAAHGVGAAYSEEDAGIYLEW